MKKVLSFSFVLMLGLVASQILPGLLGEGYGTLRVLSDTLLYVCLSFIMINVGREFELDKSKWRSYTADYFIAMATAAMPWLLIALYYVFFLLPTDLWGSGAAWKENLLLSRFAAPTSAGILFTMLAALKLNNTWMYKKIQVLAIFDALNLVNHKLSPSDFSKIIIAQLIFFCNIFSTTYGEVESALNSALE